MNDDIFDSDDPFDAELSRALGALVPESPTPDAYERALPTFVRARRRHRMLTTTGAVAIGVAAVVGIALAGGAPNFSGVHTVDPAHRGSTRPTTGHTTPDSAPGPDSTPTTAPVSGPTTGTTPTSSPASGSTNTSTSTRVGPAPGTRTQTVSSAGGSIVVTVGIRTVTLQSESPAAGYTADVRATGPTEVEVRFRIGSDGKTEHRIRLRFDSSGNLVKEIT